MSVDSGIVNRSLIQSNGWRLGCGFDKHSAPELIKLISENHKSDNAIYIVITHDCSLIHPNLKKEPYLEYFVALPIDKHNAQNTEAKNIRCLHLPILFKNELKYFKLQMAKRGFIDRSPIENCKPNEQVSLPSKSKAILVRWLSNRYTTQTLPDVFDQRIKTLVEGKKKPLRKIFQQAEATEMLGIYIDLDPPNTDLSDDESYRLTVVLLYKAEAFQGTPEYNLDEYAKQVGNCFSTAKGVEVRAVMAISDDDVSVNRLRRMRRWQLDFISFRDPGDDVALIRDDLS